MDKFNVRDVNDREIYESYMGILRISPDNDVDDATRKLLDVTNTNGVALSDSDGDMLAITFKSKAFLTNINTYGDTFEDRWLIHAQTNVNNTVFAVETVNIRPTLTVTTLADGLVNAPIISYSTDLGKVGAVCYPVGNPYDPTYFNDPLENEVRPVPSTNASDRNKFLKDQSPEWYSGNIDPEHYVRIDDKVVYHLNNENKSIPVLYTKDKILAHGHGASYIAREGDTDTYRYIYEKNLTEQLKTTENAKVTHLCWADIDKLVWDALKNIIQGDIRHTSGRYVNLGAEVDTDIRGSKMGIDKNNTDYSLAVNNSTAYSLKQTAPLVGLDVPVGNIMYNAMPYNRYMFYMAKQILANLEKDPSLASLGNETIQSVIRLKNHNHIKSFADRDPHFAANLAKNFVLCDGKPVDIEHYPALNLDNDGLNKDGSIKSSGAAAYTALKASYSLDSKICTLPLVKFNSASSILLRGATWKKLGDIKDGDKEIIMDANENNFGRYSGYPQTTTYNYRISGSEDTFNRTVESLKIYPFSMSYKRDTMHHKHKIFSSASGLNAGGINLESNMQGPGSRDGSNLYSNVNGFRRSILKIITQKYQSIIAEKEAKTQGTLDESLPSVKVGYVCYCRNGTSPEGAWNMYTAMPLNYCESTLAGFKTRGSFTNVASTYYDSDRTRYINYCLGNKDYYWKNKPIKNRAYICLCNKWDFKTGNPINNGSLPTNYTTADLPLVGGNRKIDYKAFLLLRNEAESLMPAALNGGWPRMYITNDWTQREGKNHHLEKHKTKCHSNHILTGGYKIGTLDTSKVDKSIVRPMAITSLDTKPRDLIGKLKTGVSTSASNTTPITLDDLATYEPTSQSELVDNTNMDIYTSEPAPPSLNFIPLMRI